MLVLFLINALFNWPATVPVAYVRSLKENLTGESATLCWHNSARHLSPAQHFELLSLKCLPKRVDVPLHRTAVQMTQCYSAGPEYQARWLSDVRDLIRSIRLSPGDYIRALFAKAVCL
jgi:hypothetical protein